MGAPEQESKTMTNRNQQAARNAGDMVLCTANGNLQVTTTGTTNRKNIHLTIGGRGKAPSTVTLDQRQARMFIHHILNQL